ncbi:MAG TPA: polyphenol oxidase family protein, partial [Rectinemataceae bacterium]|nr:polyphenol oxidase family protein [Rectinemataceae bacterium]
MDVATIIPSIGDSPYLEFDFGGRGRKPRAALSTLASGSMKFSHSETNPSRTSFFSQMGLDTSKVLSLELKHTRRVLLVRNPEEAGSLGDMAESSGGADGILCADSFYVPVLTVADCMPIWLFDARRNVFGLLHSGWKGTGILAEAVRLLQKDFGSNPADISAILGPCIGSCC